MTEGPEWFAPKRYGYGASLPISWQGWAITIGFVAIATTVSIRFSDKPFVIAAILVPLVALLILITKRTTRGGWRWRWGDDDSELSDR